MTIFLLTANKSAIFPIAIITFQTTQLRVWKNWKLVMPKSLRAALVFRWQWQLATFILILHSILSWESWHSSFDSHSQKGKNSLMGLFLDRFMASVQLNKWKLNIKAILFYAKNTTTSNKPIRIRSVM